MRALVTGATGFIGGHLATKLAAEGINVRCLVRSEQGAERLRAKGYEVHLGDVTDAASLIGVGKQVDIAYYLVHSMRRGGKQFRERDAAGATSFAQMAKREGIARVVYLGGLGDEPKSQHLISRNEDAQILRNEGPPLTYFRAAMVVGAASESYKTLRYLVERLPAMIAPAWLKYLTQPIAIDDVVDYLYEASQLPESSATDIQIGGPDVISYGDMLDEMARVLGKRRRPRLPVPLITPRLSSLWIGLVTPVDAPLARLLIESLSTSTIVTDPQPASMFSVVPISFEESIRRAMIEDVST